MLKRIRTGWTFTRFIYMVLGGFILGQSILDSQWLGMFIGGYFTSMGLFGFGCASGNCFGKINPEVNASGQNKLSEDIQYEEVIGK